jgi:1-acyl-sn-glycerol-3-phosphate acyltransferase
VPSRPSIQVDRLPAWRRALRYDLARGLIGSLLRCYLRPRVTGLDRLPGSPYVLCFNHLSWIDPFVLMATWPRRPRLYVYGPREADMRVGARNRVIAWLGTAVPFNPGKTNLLESTRRAMAVLAAGHALGIAGEGGLSDREGVVLRLNDGAAYFALRAGAPLVPVGIVGTRWLRFGKRIQVMVGEPISTAGLRADRETVNELTERLQAALPALLPGPYEHDPPGPLGRFMTDVFTDRRGAGRRSGSGTMAATTEREEDAQA